MLDLFISYELRGFGNSYLPTMAMWKVLLLKGEPYGRNFCGRDNNVEKIASWKELLLQ